MLDIFLDECLLFPFKKKKLIIHGAIIGPYNAMNRLYSVEMLDFFLTTRDSLTLFRSSFMGYAYYYTEKCIGREYA